MPPRSGYVLEVSRVEKLDAYQREHTWLGAPLAVVYKFTEDRGPYLAALVTYYVFVSVFPLLLVFTSAIGFFLDGNSSLRQALLSSALKDFPIIGPELRNNVSHFHGSGAGLAIGIILTLYGGMGATQAAQYAFNRMYAVPRNEQPNPIKSRVRSILLLFLLGGGVLLSTGVAVLASSANSLSDNVSSGVRWIAVLLSFLINVGVFVGAFQLLTARKLHIRQVLRGGILAAVGWELLQTLGTRFISHELQHSSSVYGTFGLVLATLAWIYVQALVVMMSAEINVVVSRRLWPRALLTPFTDDVDLTDADRRTYQLHARTQRYKGFETVETSFGEKEAPEPAEPVAADEPR
jgi:membrane protein